MKYYTYRVVIAIDENDPADKKDISDWIVSRVEYHDDTTIMVDSIIEEH